MNTYTLQLANVGDVETVLCRRGSAVLLTQKFSTSVNRDECDRIQRADGIITEVCQSGQQETDRNFQGSCGRALVVRQNKAIAPRNHSALR